MKPLNKKSKELSS